MCFSPSPEQPPGVKREDRSQEAKSRNETARGAKRGPFLEGPVERAQSGCRCRFFFCQALGKLAFEVFQSLAEIRQFVAQGGNLGFERGEAVGSRRRGRLGKACDLFLGRFSGEKASISRFFLARAFR